MKSSAALLLAAGTCGVGFLAGWLAHSGGTCNVDLPPTQPLQRSERPAVTDAPDLGMPVSRVAIQPAASAPPDPAPASQRPEIPKSATTVSSDPHNLPESTMAEMRAKYDAIRKILTEKMTPVLTQRFDDGLTEHVSDDPVCWKGGDSEEERRMIYGLRSSPSGWDRTVLPRWQYPELYALKDESLRLERLMIETRMAEQQASMAQK